MANSDPESSTASIAEEIRVDSATSPSLPNETPSVRRGRFLFLLVITPIILADGMQLLLRLVSGEGGLWILFQFGIVIALTYTAWRGEPWAWMLLVLAFSFSAAVSLWPDVDRSVTDILVGTYCAALAVLFLLSKSIHEFLRYQEAERRALTTARRSLRR